MKKSKLSLSPLTMQVLQLIDQERPSRPNSQTIMELPANIYTTIRQMYNSFKKDNEAKILQNKVYELKILQNGMDVENKISPVSLNTLCESHSKHLDSDTIEYLMILKNYLPSDLQKQLIKIISKQLVKIHNFQTILKGFKKILKARECIDDKVLYQLVFKQMTNKIISFDIEFNDEQISKIYSFLLSLPYLEVEALEFIANLYDKIIEISDFQKLQVIFVNIYQKTSANTNETIEKLLMKCLVKVNVDENIRKIEQKIEAIKNKFNQNKPINDLDRDFVACLQKQVIAKIVFYQKLDKNSKKNSILQQKLNQKLIKMIDFVFLVLQNQFLVFSLKINDGEISPLWVHFIAWFQQNIHFPQFKQYICSSLSRLVNKSLTNSKSALRLIRILIQIEGGINQTQHKFGHLLMKINNDQVFSETVSNFIVKEIVLGKNTSKRYLNCKEGKQIFALGVLRDEAYQSIVINPSHLEYIEVLLETFNLPNVTSFYKRIISNPSQKTAFQVYLSALQNQKPRKYKDFFVTIDGFQLGQIFEQNQHFLLKYFYESVSAPSEGNTTPGQIVVAFLKDIAGHLPSKFAIEIMKGFINKFKTRPQQKVVYHQAVRTLHIILSTRDAQQLCNEFKKHLRQIVQNKIIQADDVFKNVPERMTNDLNTYYNGLNNTVNG